MSTEILLPTAEGAPTAWILDAGASKTVAVQTNDGDTTRIRRGGTVVLGQFFDVANSALTAADIINSVSVKALVKVATGGAGSRIQLAIQLPGGEYTSATIPVTSDTAYLTYTKTWTTNPDTAAAWVLADIDGTYKMDCGIYNATTSIIFYCTQIFIEVDYTLGGVGRLIDGGLVNAGLINGRLIR